MVAMNNQHPLAVPLHEAVLQVHQLRTAGKMAEADSLKARIQQQYPNADEAPFKFTTAMMARSTPGGRR